MESWLVLNVFVIVWWVHRAADILGRSYGRSHLVLLLHMRLINLHEFLLYRWFLLCMDGLLSLGVVAIDLRAFLLSAIRTAPPIIGRSRLRIESAAVSRLIFRVMYWMMLCPVWQSKTIVYTWLAVKIAIVSLPSCILLKRGSDVDILVVLLLFWLRQMTLLILIR